MVCQSDNHLKFIESVNNYIDDFIDYLVEHKDSICTAITDAPCCNVSIYYNIPCDGSIPTVSLNIEHIPTK